MELRVVWLLYGAASAEIFVKNSTAGYGAPQNIVTGDLKSAGKFEKLQLSN